MITALKYPHLFAQMLLLCVKSGQLQSIKHITHRNQGGTVAKRLDQGIRANITGAY
jgi:hypothetical protein